MKIRDFTGGLNTYDIPENLQDNEFMYLENICYDEGAILRTRGGLKRVLNATEPKSMYPYYLGSTLHIVHTKRKGLYDGKTKLMASFTGFFCADEYAHCLYLTNGKYLKKYDGSGAAGLVSCGLVAPAVPTVTTQGWQSKVLETFDVTPVEFTKAVAPYDGGTGGVITRDTTTKYSGTSSIRVELASDMAMHLTKTYAGDQDWSTFAVGLSSQYDWITLKLKCFCLEQIGAVGIVVDCNGGTSTDIMTSLGIINPNQMYESKSKTTIPVMISTGSGTSTIPGSTVLPTTGALTVAYWPVTGNEWSTWAFPKCDFTRVGNTLNKGWNTIKTLKIIVYGKPVKTGEGYAGTSRSAIWIDAMSLEGAGGADTGLMGTFAFCAEWYNSATEEYFEVSDESAFVSFNNTQIKISAQPLTAAYPQQANTWLLWARAEADDHWYLMKSITKASATSVTATLSMGIQTLIMQDELGERAGISPMPRTLPDGTIRAPGTSNNSPPPQCDTLCVHRGKMFYGKNDRIYHSKAGMPTAVPPDSWISATSLSDPIVGFYSDGNNLQVFSQTSNYNYIFAGEYQTNWVYMGYLAKGRVTAGCVNQHTISQGIHCSSQGIAIFDGVESRILSNKVKPNYYAIRGILTSYAKEYMQAVVFDNLYIITNPYYSMRCLVMDQQDGLTRFFEWKFKKDVHCCMVDTRKDTLYLGMNNGIYLYDTAWSSDQKYPSGRNRIKITAITKNHEFAAEDKDSPVERFMVHTSTGGATLKVEIKIDGVTHGVGRLATTRLSSSGYGTEKEGLMDIGAFGSFVQCSMAATVAATFPLKIYAIEVS